MKTVEELPVSVRRSTPSLHNAPVFRREADRSREKSRRRNERNSPFYLHTTLHSSTLDSAGSSSASRCKSRNNLGSHLKARSSETGGVSLRGRARSRQAFPDSRQHHNWTIFGVPHGPMQSQQRRPIQLHRRIVTD